MTGGGGGGGEREKRAEEGEAPAYGSAPAEKEEYSSKLSTLPYSPRQLKGQVVQKIG